jgi:hypothetical protein
MALLSPEPQGILPRGCWLLRLFMPVLSCGTFRQKT